MEEVLHIVPVNRGGGKEGSNLMSVCKFCNNNVHKCYVDILDNANINLELTKTSTFPRIMHKGLISGHLSSGAIMFMLIQLIGMILEIRNWAQNLAWGLENVKPQISLISILSMIVIILFLMKVIL